MSKEKSKTTLFIIYYGDNEIIITTPKQEKECLKHWFAENTGRLVAEDADVPKKYRADQLDADSPNITVFDRDEINEPGVVIHSKLCY